jgi:hypothetical protein
MRLSRGCHTLFGSMRERPAPQPSPDHPCTAVRSVLCADRGSLSLMIVVLFAVLAALAGVVVDGGRKLAGDENANAVAQEAARAAATVVDTSRAYASGSFVVDEQQALAAARGYLVAAGYRQNTVVAQGSDAIKVSVRITEPTTFLALIGVESFTCTGSATAELVTGVTGGP